MPYLTYRLALFSASLAGVHDVQQKQGHHYLDRSSMPYLTYRLALFSTGM
jgi:hypothetical protein